MAESGDDSKSEEPTGRRLEEAAQKGQVAYTKELGSTLGVMAVLLIMYWFSQMLIGGLSNTFEGVFKNLAPWSSGRVPFESVIFPSLKGVVGILGMILAGAFIAPLIGHVAQKGIEPRPEAAEPSLEKIDPIQGFKRLFSAETLVKFVKNFIKSVGFMYILYHVVEPHLIEIAYSANMPYEHALKLYMSIIWQFLLYAIIFLTVIIAADYFYQRYQNLKSLMMSRQEIKDEMKDTEGSPEFKRKVREIQIERSKRQIDKEVPKATVIVTNPTHFAVAIKYVRGENPVPKVVAKGADILCQRIKEIAKQHNIPIVESPPLARALYREVKVGQMIPRSFYKSVAKILAAIFKLDDEKKKQRQMVLKSQRY